MTFSTAAATVSSGMSALVSSASDRDVSVPRSLGTDNPTGLPEQPRQGPVALKRLRTLVREVAKRGTRCDRLCI